MTADRHSDRIAALERELEAARETIDVLKQAVERHQRHHGLDQFAVQKAMSNLEGTIHQRTRELRKSEERYRALFDHSPVMALTVDDRGVITDANFSAGALQTEGPPLQGQPLAQLFATEARKPIERLLVEGSGTEHELLLADGRIVDATVAKVPGHSDGQVLLREITDWLDLQREVQHSRRLAAVGRLAAGVAHEINNPLAVLHLALCRLERLSAAKREASVDEMLSHTERIARIVENLQSFASPRPPEPTVLSVMTLIAAASEIAEPTIRTMKLETAIEPPGLQCVADRGQLEQVLVNLLTNASRATDGRGTVQISAREESGWIKLRVADDGPGIPPEMLEDVFTPFVAGDSKERSGMGLGLSISWGIVRENAGTISARNMADGGACFELSLPSAADAQWGAAALPSSRGEVAPSDGQRTANEQPAAQQASERSIRRLLCVEDEPSLREMMVLLLEAGGFDAVGVNTAEKALERLADGGFDAVISDLRLPRMSGRQLADTVAARHPQLRGRVVLMSGLFKPGEVKGPFLQKPFTEERLFEVIDEIERVPAP